MALTQSSVLQNHLPELVSTTTNCGPCQQAWCGMVDPNEVNLKELEDFESGGTQEMIKENGVQFFLLFFNTFFFFFCHTMWHEGS